MPISGIIGHAEAVSALDRSLAAGRPAHAYLFSGPAGIGKGTLALALAKALNCPNPDPPCNACTSCRRIDAGRHTDVECISPGGPCDESDHDHATDAGRDIRICQSRRIERVLGLAPFEGRRRVVILEPAEAMNAQAADAFLKTLEEPPSGAVIILVTANEGALSETIRSRCRRVPLRPLPAAQTERALREQFDAPPDEAATLARLFGGRLGHAAGALRDPAFAERRAALLAGAAAAAGGSLGQRFTLAEKLAAAYGKRETAKPEPAETDRPSRASVPAVDGNPRTRGEVLTLLNVWIEWWRDLLLICAGADDVVVNIDHALVLHELANRLDTAAAAAGVRALRELRRDLDSNVNPRLALEACMIRLPWPRTLARAGV